MLAPCQHVLAPCYSWHVLAQSWLLVEVEMEAMIGAMRRVATRDSWREARNNWREIIGKRGVSARHGVMTGKLRVAAQCANGIWLEASWRAG